MKIHSLLSLYGHYDWFIEGFALITASMKHLTYKRVKFKWNERCEKSFYELKRKLMSILVLTLLEGQEEVVVYNGASRRS